MAQYFIDPADYSVTTGAPSGWAINGSSVFNVLQVVDRTFDGTTYRVIEVQKSAYSNQFNVLVNTDIPATADAEVLVLVSVSDRRANSSAVRVKTTAALRIAAADTGYVGGLSRYSNTNIMSKAIVRLDSYTTGAILANTTEGDTEDGLDNHALRYFERFKVEGTALKMKYWMETDDEPTDWLIETTDSTLTTGLVGIANMSALSGTKRIYQFSVGTDGDAAPSSAPATGPNTPINPSVTNLLATTARLNWEQG